MIKPIQWRNRTLILLDQRRLPRDVRYLRLKRVADVAGAISTLAVRGAPAIGIAAAYGVVLGVCAQMRDGAARRNARGLRRALDRDIKTLRATRPTAVNLFWALERMRRRFQSLPAAATGADAAAALEDEAVEIHREDEARCEAIGRWGATLLPKRATVVTHCNAGALATGGIGTALGVVYAAARAGKAVRVFADETRPLLQGARLTAFELKQNGIDVTLMADSMSASLIRKIPVDAVIVGADRIARNGDTANKIGTYALAINARYHGVPFYVAAPASTFDLTLAGGKDIPIEERNPDEVTGSNSQRIAPAGIRVFNPAFDVTPAELITAIITDKGIIRPVRVRTVMSVIGGKRKS